MVCVWKRLDQLPLTGLAAEATDLLQKLSLDSKSEAGEDKQAKEKVYMVGLSSTISLNHYGTL